MSTRFLAAALFALAFPTAGYAQDASDQPYFRFNFGTVAKTVGLPEANVNTDVPTGITVAVPCVQCRARANSTFSFLPASFGTLDYAAWELLSGNPPGGGIDHSTGMVQGTVAGVGSSTFRIGVHDSRNEVVSSPPITLTVIPAPTLAYDSSQGAFNRSYTGNPRTSSVLGPASYQVTSGALPDGLGLNKSTGQISGSVRGSATGLVVTLTDSDGAKVSSAPFGIITDQPSVLYAGGDYAGRVGVFISVTPEILNFGSGLTLKLTGTLPPNMTLDGTTGTISGAPSQVGTFDNIVVTASDFRGTPVAGRVLRFVISKPALSYASATTWVGQDYRQSPAVSFFKGPSFYKSGGTFPDGLQVIESTGLLTGRPSVAGTFGGLSVLASDPEGALATSAPFQIKVLPALTASIPTPTKGRIGVPLNIQATSSNFESAPTWTFNGTLPSQVIVGKTTGLVSGSPTSSGVFSGLTLTATQGGGTVQTNQFTIDVAPAFTLAYDTPVTIARSRVASLPAAVAGALSPPSFARYAGTLPTGLSVNPTTGAIEGTPTALGTQPNIQVVATDVGGKAYSNPVAITVVDPTATMASFQGRVGQYLSRTATSTFVTAPKWTSTGTALPTGLGVTAAGVLEGTPQAVGTTTNLRLTATGTDGAVTTPAFQVQIFSDLSVPTVVSPRTGTVGTSLAIPAPTVQGLLGTATYALVSGGGDVSDTLGQVCPGLGFSRSTAVISGRPSAVCSVSLSYQVTDATLPKTAQSPAFSLDVTPALQTANVPSASVQEGQTVAFSVTTTIDTPTWTVSGQPDWMTFTASGKTYSTSSVSGDETQPRTYRVAVTATGNGTSSVSTTDVTITPASVTLANAAARPGGSFSADVAESMTATGTWSSTATPADVTLNAVSAGKLTGTAPANASGAVATRTLRATYTGPAVAAGARAQAFADATLTVHPAFALAAVGNYAGQAGVDVNLAPPAPSGVIGNVTYQLWQGASNVSATIGTTCPGLSFAGGRITGRPTAACSPTLSYKATDDGNGVANLSASTQSGSFTFTVAPATVTPSTSAVAVNEGENVYFTATTSLQNPTWSLSGNPSWMSVSNSGGTAVVNSVSGDVTGPTTYRVKLVASSGGATATSGEIAVTVNNLTGSLGAMSARGKQPFSASFSSGMVGGTLSVSASNLDVTSLAISNGTVTGVAPDVSTNTLRTVSVTQTGPAVTGGGAPAQVVASATLTAYPSLRVANPTNATETWQSDVGTGIYTPKVTGNAGPLTYSLLVDGTDVSDRFGDFCLGLTFNKATGAITGVVDGAITPSCDVTFNFRGNDAGAAPVPATTVTSAPVRLVVYKQLRVRFNSVRALHVRENTDVYITGTDDYDFNGTWRIDTTPQYPNKFQYDTILSQNSKSASWRSRAPYNNNSGLRTVYIITFWHSLGSLTSRGALDVNVYDAVTVRSNGNSTGTRGVPISAPSPSITGAYGTKYFEAVTYNPATAETGTTDVAGNIPAVCPGLSLDRSTGVIVGTPQAACNFGRLRLRLTDYAETYPGLQSTAVEGGAFSIVVN